MESFKHSTRKCSCSSHVHCPGLKPPLREVFLCLRGLSRVSLQRLFSALSVWDGLQEAVSSLLGCGFCQRLVGRQCAMSSSFMSLLSEYRTGATCCVLPTSSECVYEFVLCEFNVETSLCECSVLLKSLAVCFLSSRLFWLLCCMKRSSNVWPFCSVVFSL